MNRIFLNLIVLMIATGLYAQPGARREMIQDRVEAQRIAFITQKLELTPDEAAKFWPLYNEYKIKQQELRKAIIVERIQQRGVDNLSDGEAEEIIAQHFALEENLLQLKREYYDRFKNALPTRKIVRLAGAEMEFNRKVLEQVKERMGER
jgi:hypothetical protein